MFLTRREKRRMFWGVGVLLVVLIGIFLFLTKSELQPQIQQNVDMLQKEGGQEMTTEEVTYFETTNGYFARPTAPGDYPGVIMIHEWWGLNDHIKRTAEQLAQEGYLVLAVDLFKGSVATTSDQARDQTGSLNQ